MIYIVESIEYGTNVFPDILYHSVRGRGLNSRGGISAYDHRDFRGPVGLGSDFKNYKNTDKFIYLSIEPMDSLAYKIDTSKLDLSQLKYTGQQEGYLVYRGDIPEEAIIK
jgi:hypothetical protein